MPNASLYDVIQEASAELGPISNDDGIVPAALEKTLEQTESALAGAWEFLAEKLTSDVTAIVNEGKPNAIGYEDIGRILLHAGHIRHRAEEIIEQMARLTIVAHDAFSQASGYDGDGTMFDQYGQATDVDEFKVRAQGFGFDV